MLTFALFLMLPAHAEPALPDDPAWWEAQSRAVLAGPGACVDVRGEAHMKLMFVRPGGLMGPGEAIKAGASGAFAWRGRDGRAGDSPRWISSAPKNSRW